MCLRILKAVTVICLFGGIIVALTGCIVVKLQNLRPVIRGLTERLGPATNDIPSGIYDFDGSDVLLIGQKLEGIDSSAYLLVAEKKIKGEQVSNAPLLFWKLDDGYLGILITRDVSLAVWAELTGETLTVGMLDCDDVPESVQDDFFRPTLGLCSISNSDLLLYFATLARENALQGKNVVRLRLRQSIRR